MHASSVADHSLRFTYNEAFQVPNYSEFFLQADAFEIQDALPGFDILLLANSPEHAFSLGVQYARERVDAGFNLRWVDDFRWGVGPFQGDVESCATVDLDANYQLTDEVKVGLNVANLFDDKHWESFGGDLMGRRALVNLQYGW